MSGIARYLPAFSHPFAAVVLIDDEFTHGIIYHRSGGLKHALSEAVEIRFYGPQDTPRRLKIIDFNDPRHYYKYRYSPQTTGPT